MIHKFISFYKDNITDSVKHQLLDYNEDLIIKWIDWATHNNYLKDSHTMEDYIPKRIKVPYTKNDFINYEFQYKLKKNKLTTFNLFYKAGFFDIPTCRFNPNESMQMLDLIGIECESKCKINNYMLDNKFESTMLIPEQISEKRFVFHKLNEFLQFDFNEYFELNKNEYLCRENLFNWTMIFEPTRFNFNEEKKKKMCKKTLINNPEKYAINMLEKLIKQKKKVYL